MLDIDMPSVGDEEKEILRECIDGGSIAQGRYVHRFEAAFAQRCGMKHACTAMNGTAALHLALLALRVGPGDEVLVPSLTFIASASPISFCGATPVFVDCDPRTWCMDVADLKRKVTSKSKVVIPVHLYGNACDMAAVAAVAAEHGLKVIEDCAEAFGTLYRRKQVGGFSDISFFSFYRNKHFMTGEGGACLTNDPALLHRMQLLRSHGKEKAEDLTDDEFAQKQFISSELGYNYRMTDLQAAVGLAQLAKVDGFLAKRVAYAELYRELLRGADLTFPQHHADSVQHSYWGFPVLVRDPGVKLKIMTAFRQDGIRLRSFFNPCHTQPFYAQLKAACPVSLDVAGRGIVLPNIQSMGEADLRAIAKRFVALVGTA